MAASCGCPAVAQQPCLLRAANGQSGGLSFAHNVLDTVHACVCACCMPHHATEELLALSSRCDALTPPPPCCDACEVLYACMMG